MVKRTTKTRQEKTKSASARKPDLHCYYDALVKLGIPRTEVGPTLRILAYSFNILLEEEFNGGANVNSRAEKVAVSMTANLLKRHCIRDCDRKAGELVLLLDIGFILDEMRKKLVERQKVPYDPGLDDRTQSEIVSVVINDIESSGIKLADDEKRLCEWLVDSAWREYRLRKGILSNYWLQSWYWLLECALEEIGWKLKKHRFFDEEKFAFWKEWSSYFLTKLELVKVEANRRGLKLQPSSIPDPEIGEPFLISPYFKEPINFDYVPRKGKAWMRPEWQQDIYLCLAVKRDDIDRPFSCGWTGLGDDRKYHTEDTKEHDSKSKGHDSFNLIFPARLRFVPHYQIQCRCGLKLVPAVYIKNKELSHCPKCNSTLIFPAAYRDPNDYGHRVCHDCATSFSLNRYRWFSQGFFCPKCLEKRENKHKQQRRRSRRTP